MSKKTNWSDWLPVLFILVLIAIPVLWAWATVSSCGWKGFFVECRITQENSK